MVPMTRTTYTFPSHINIEVGAVGGRLGGHVPPPAGSNGGA